ncbi:hypothetical protein ACF0H5_019481 [Mactra antiquata]
MKCIILKILLHVLILNVIICQGLKNDLSLEFQSDVIELGQIGGLAVNSFGELHIFHRGENIWNSLSFDEDNVYTLKYFPIEVNTIVILNKNGMVKRSFGNNTYYLPHGLTLDHHGNMWLTDVALHQVFRIPQNGTTPDMTVGYRFEPGSDVDHFCKPTDVAVQANGDFFVADGYCNSRIIKYDQYGYFIKQWGTKSAFYASSGFPPPGTFNFPHALALAEEKQKICTADRENGRIQCFDLNGNFINQIHPKQFGRNVYAIEYSSHHGGVLFAVNGPEPNVGDVDTQGFTVDINTGELLSTWNIPNSTLSHPHDIAVDNKNHAVYVGELNPSIVWKFDMPSAYFGKSSGIDKWTLMAILVTICVLVLILLVLLLWLHHTGKLTLICKNDKISQDSERECIKPVTIDRSSAGKVGKIRIEDDGSYFSVNEGIETKLQKAQITLNDCLACSGCITSAESVLITQQSQEELYRILQHNKTLIEAGSKPKIVIVSVCPQVHASLAAKYNLTMTECAKKLTAFFKKLGVHYVYDTNIARGFSLIESCKEFVNRFKDSETCKIAFPMLASACPGWICYAEKTHGSYILPYISKVKSPQQIMGSIVKDYVSSKLNHRSDEIYHVTVMPCFDKKLEASRSDFYNDIYNTRDVDCVITAGEVELMLEKEKISLNDVDEQQLDTLFNAAYEIFSHIGGGSGGYLEHIFRYTAQEIFGTTVDKIQYKVLRNQDFQEVTLETEGRQPIKMAFAYGFRNIQNIVQKIKRGKCVYHFVEIMACPSGCLNGGGQIRPEGEVTPKDRLVRVTELYNSLNTISPWNDDTVKSLYEEWLSGTDSDKSKNMLHTQYHEVEKMTNALAIKW